MIFHEFGLFSDILLTLTHVIDFVVPSFLFKFNLRLKLKQTRHNCREAVLNHLYLLIHLLLLSYFIFQIVDCGTLQLHLRCLALIQQLLWLNHLKTNWLGLLASELPRGFDVLLEDLLFKLQVRHLVCVFMVAVVAYFVVNQTKNQRLYKILLQVQMLQGFIGPHWLQNNFAGRFSDLIACDIERH